MKLRISDDLRAAADTAGIPVPTALGCTALSGAVPHPLGIPVPQGSAAA